MQGVGDPQSDVTKSEDNDASLVMKQDFAAIRRAFETGAYDLMNIYSNRLMANAALLGPKEFVVPGILAKELATDCIDARRAEDRLKALKPAAKDLLDSLEENLDSKHAGSDRDWKSFVVFFDITRETRMDEIEAKVYQEDKSFSSRSADVLVEWLSDHQLLLFESRNLFLKGILNELGRIIKSHGADGKTTVLWVLLRVFDRYYDYLAYSSLMLDGTFDETRIKGETTSALEMILEYARADSPEEFYRLATEICSHLITQWRKYYVFYMEPLRIPETGARKIELPKEARERIGEIIVKTLKKEIEKP